MTRAHLTRSFACIALIGCSADQTATESGVGAGGGGPGGSQAADGSGDGTGTGSGVGCGTRCEGGASDGGNRDAQARPDGAPGAVSECSQPQPDWVFCSGFEEGSFDIWDNYDRPGAPTETLPTDPGPFNNGGNHVLRLYAPPGRSGAGVTKVLTTGHDRLYARWYMQWENGHDFAARNHGSGIHAGPHDLLGVSGNRPSGSNWFSSWLEPNTDNSQLQAYTYYPGMHMDCADPNGACWGDGFPCMYDQGQTYCKIASERPKVTAPSLQTGRWYCIEMEMDGGIPTQTAAGANGVLDFWVDGLEIGPWNNLWLRNTPDLKLDILWLSTFFHGDHADVGVRYDDAVMSTSRIGCR